MRKGITTIKISKKTVELLNRLKIHPRQPYEEVILKLISAQTAKAKEILKFDAKREITTIKLTKDTVGKLNRLKVHPRQPYEEVILRLISQNEEARSKT